MRKWCETYYEDSKADLATCFIERCLDFCVRGGTTVLVTPQNWLFLTGYTKFRKRLIIDRNWNAVARLGSNAFQDMNWWAATTALLILTNGEPKRTHRMLGFDVSNDKRQTSKSAMLRGDTLSE
ncbi:MAG: SAM-dependent DNA methyltransferase, partial [Verrucomicrobiaceae bacterium]